MKFFTVAAILALASFTNANENCCKVILGDSCPSDKAARQSYEARGVALCCKSESQLNNVALDFSQSCPAVVVEDVTPLEVSTHNCCRATGDVTCPSDFPYDPNVDGYINGVKVKACCVADGNIGTIHDLGSAPACDASAIAGISGKTMLRTRIH